MIIIFCSNAQRNSCEEVYCERSFKVLILVTCVSLGLRKQLFLKYTGILDFSWLEYFHVLNNGPSTNLDSNITQI